MTIYADASRLAGRTPLVRLSRLFPGETEVLAKLEFYNPTNSVKDRVAAAIVDAAEASGALLPGGVIVEGTSGNTGIGLACVGAARGYKVIIAMPESMSAERRALLRAFGAELVLTPAAAGMQAAVDRAAEIAATTPGAILASQFANAANPAAHRATTAEEIWADTDGRLDYFVAGVGTGGTITGVGQVLRERSPGVHVVAVEPAESPLLNGGQAGPHGIQGLGANFVPPVFDATVVDEVLDIATPDAIAWARRAATQEGLLVGISSGAALAGVARIVARPEAAGKRVVVIAPDWGERYVSTPLFAVDGG